MFSIYLEIGIDHILDLDAIDHMLFLVAMVIIYRLKNWKAVILLATAFTIGHSLTLYIATKNLIPINEQVVEILIALSITLTALMNLVSRGRGSIGVSRYSAALFFGMIHGLGFSRYIKSLLGDEVLIPLLGFNVGVEIAQVIVVIAVLILNYVLISLLKIKQRHIVMSTSAVIFLLSLQMIIERI